MKSIFEEHDGMLFRMLEEPVPLTDDAKMPCLVRLIQDDSPMGKHNKDLHGFDPERLTPKICAEVIDVNDLSDPNRGSARCDGFMSIQYYRYELIGTHVKEGSADWAWHQMMKGEKIRYAELISQRFCAIKKGSDYCAFYESDGSELHINTRNDGNKLYIDTRRTYGEFIKYSKMCGISSWQIHKEPEEEPPKEPDNLYLNIKPSNPADWCFDKKNLLVLVDDNFKGIVGENVTREQVGEIVKLLTEPAPQYKVGDWVEVEETNQDKKTIHHVLIDRMNKLSDGTYNICFKSWYSIVFCHELTHREYDLRNADTKIKYRITRKLDPSEAVIHIGCLSGTVSFVDADRFILRGIGNSEMANACIMFKMLDAATCVLVESLLKAQDEEK